MQATNRIFSGTLVEGLVETLRYNIHDDESKSAFHLAISMLRAESDGIGNPYSCKLDLHTRSHLLEDNHNLQQWVMEYYKERFPL